MNVVSISVQVPTGMLLMILALVTNGKSSIDAIIFVAPMPTLLHNPLMYLWEEATGRSGRCAFR
jgi:hypothetical protein